MRTHGATQLQTTGEVIAITNIFSGQTFRCFSEAFTRGEIARGPSFEEDGLGPTHSRILGLADPATLQIEMAAVKRLAKQSGLNCVFSQGVWHEVHED